MKHKKYFPRIFVTNQTQSHTHTEHWKHNTFLLFLPAYTGFHEMLDIEMLLDVPVGVSMLSVPSEVCELSCSTCRGGRKV